MFHPHTFQMRGTQERKINFVKKTLRGIISGSLKKMHENEYK